MLAPSAHFSQLLEITPAMESSVEWSDELDDCAFSSLASIKASDDANMALTDVIMVCWVGARPRGPGMERSDLLAKFTGGIFKDQGAPLIVSRMTTLRLYSWKPRKYECLGMCIQNAPDVPPEQITAMTRLDHNRAKYQIAKKAACDVSEVKKLTIWGNH